jgi:nitrite reductase/ring-hydroxylating ferredoxin subunit
MAGLAAAIEKRGGRIYCDTELHDLREEDPIRLITSDDLEIRAWAVVIATNTPINNRVAIHTKQAGYRTYAIAIRTPAGAVPRALYWDTTQEAGQAAHAPYHYVRTANFPVLKSDDGRPTLANDELLIVGGEDHKTGQAHDSDERWSRLESWIRDRFPHLGEVVYRWSGQVWEPVDRVAFIGRNPGGPENMYVATGDSGMGMTHGAIAGMLLADLIAERPNAWAKLYDPSRITLRSALEFTRENLNMAAQYLDWLSAGTVDRVEDIKPGSGAIIRRGLSPFAVFRDESGAIHECSAVCPHLGGIVSWNTAERTWDCPCHGSRFSPDGAVLTGPANSPLQNTRAGVHSSNKGN